MTAENSSQSLANRRRQILTLSASGAAVFIIIATIASYSVFRLDRTVADYTSTIETLNEMADSARVSQVRFKTQVQEWKNTLLRGYVKNDYDTYHTAFLARRDEVETDLDKLSAQARDVGFPTMGIEALRKSHSELDAAYDAALQKFVPDDPLSIRIVDAAVRGRDRPVNEAFDALVADVKAFADERRSQLRGQISDMAGAMRLRLWIAVVLGLAVVGVGAAFALRSLSKS
ncbi:MAG: hypothetical protein V4441_07440 [Pseudomonadota bacterium]